MRSGVFREGKSDLIEQKEGAFRFPSSISEDARMLTLVRAKEAVLMVALDRLKVTPGYQRYQQLQTEMQLQQEQKENPVPLTIESEIRTVKNLIPRVGVLGENFADLKQSITLLSAQFSKIKETQRKKQEFDKLHADIGPQLKDFERKHAELVSKKSELQERISEARSAVVTFFWKTKVLTRKWFFDAISQNDVEKMEEYFNPLFINHTNRAGFTPLTLAIMEGHYNAALWLLGKGADPDMGVDIYMNHEGATPLMFAILCGRDNAFLELLMNFGADPRKLSRDGLTSINLAAQLQHPFLPSLVVGNLFKQGA